VLDGKERVVWVRVGGGVEALSGAGRAVWNQPAVVRNALREMLSVLPVTHVELDLARLLARGEPPSTWSQLLDRAGDWRGLLDETAAATGDAVRGLAEWGIGLPNPAAVGEALGDPSERGRVKAGLRLASFLQGFREAGLRFVTVEPAETAPSERALAPIFRNAELYGWRRAAIVASTTETVKGAEIRLLRDGGVTEVRDAWARGELVGAGLDSRFWAGEALADAAPPRALLFGEIPAGTAAAAIVAAGRNLERWLG
jgi:hypothetical protein